MDEYRIPALGSRQEERMMANKFADSYDDDYDNFDEDFFEDDDDEELFDCGMMADGGCSKAGTEECDWECPHGA